MVQNTNLASNDTVVLFLGHVLDNDIVSTYKNIKASCVKNIDVFFLADNTRGVFNKFQKQTDYYLFTLDQLIKLEYPGKTNISYGKNTAQHSGYHKNRNFVVGNTELPLLLFSRDFPNYKHYWVVEYDVRFTGDWKELFDYFNHSKADLLATSLIRHDKVKNWFRWQSLNFNGKAVKQDEFIRGFFPIYRISNRALQQLEKDYRLGVSGHYECLMPTLLFHLGMALEDIGGDGEFVKKENHNRFYQNMPLNDSHAPGTFVFRPAMDKPGTKINTLWHPVKHRPFWRRVLSRLKQLLVSKKSR